MTESDKKLLLAKLREWNSKKSERFCNNQEAMEAIECAEYDMIKIVESIQTEPSLDELLESLPTKRG